MVFAAKGRKVRHRHLCLGLDIASLPRGSASDLSPQNKEDIRKAAQGLTKVSVSGNHVLLLNILVLLRKEG